MPGEPADPASEIEAARERVADLACDDGDDGDTFQVACTRTGARPEPVAGREFATVADAEAAADAARRYRDALRALDPALPDYDFAVYETGPEPLQVASVRERTADRRENGLPRCHQSVTVAGARDDEWLRVENCPVIHVRTDADPLDDEVIGRQLDAKL